MENVTKVLFVPQLPVQLRVAAYARVSSGKDAMLHSLAAQISYYNDLIQSRIDWIFAGIYADEAISGTKSDRPEFQRLVEDCEHGLIDLVITKSISRFARNTLTTLSVVRKLKELGIDIFFERENIHSISDDGEFMLTLLASYAQEESRSVSENIKWRIRKMFVEGRPNTGRFLGYRLVDGKLQIVPSEAVVVQEIFSSYLSGLGKMGIVKKLRLEGVHLSPAGIHAMLMNEKYTGDLILQKYFKDDVTNQILRNEGQLPKYYVKDSHEAIISKEMFAAVQKERNRRIAQFAIDKTPKEYAFSGMMRCGLCGNLYLHKTNNANTKYARPIWRCSKYDHYGKSDCTSRQIKEWLLQKLTAEVLEIPVFDEEVFTSQVEGITAYPDKLVFHFVNGETREKAWQPASRRDSWTLEMKQKAREKSLEYLRRQKDGD